MSPGTSPYLSKPSWRDKNWCLDHTDIECIDQEAEVEGLEKKVQKNEV